MFRFGQTTSLRLLSHSTRIVQGFHPRLVPTKVAAFVLSDPSTVHLGHKTVMDFLICTSDIPKVSNFMSDGVRLSRLLKFNKIGRFCKGNG